MKQVNFSHSGGFPLEQETLERLQTAYRTELFGALKSHLGISPDNDYIVAPATNKKEGWAIIRQDGEGILYPIQIGTPTNFLKTTRTGTSLTYGTGVLKNAYFDYDAQYISPEDYANRPESPQMTDALAIHYYDLNKPAFIVIKDIKSIEADINLINQTYLPLDGSKAMKGDLDLDIYQLSKLDIKESSVASVRVADFRLGSIERRGKLKPYDSTGRALVDSSDTSTTSLSLNYASDWENTNIGGKVYLNNINTSNATGSLLVVDNANQVTKSNTLIDSLLNRITALENKLATIATGAEVNVASNWNSTDPLSDAYIHNKPTISVSDILARGSFDIGDLNKTDIMKTVYFTQINTSNYMIFGSIRSKSEYWSNDNDVIWAVKPINTFAFELYLREVSSDIQNIAFDYIIVKK
ncbi:hypothetical protein IUY40_18535 [Flavobacterium sp. ALJ2]|uniref:hypothetical protein n=1 Tax=Flavobacterium sp. ALJ2 TaxID=2786960 RepID=UPI00189D55DF|nr:hypothetical protein [Flavobacterium sp. ALJ2]MBF7093534.1 hypothetical protein [Flavobacterium sp. ALJ2]